jgi:GTP cyclohydrolase I
MQESLRESDVTDIRHTPDHRNIDIDRVGIKNLTYPLVLRDMRNELQHTTAEINFYVDLPRQFKGTHMSRFVEVLNHFRDEIDLRRIDEILLYARERLSADTVHLEVTFPYFISKTAPVTGVEGLLSYSCTIAASSHGADKCKPVLTVRVPVTAVCPCSKQIADRGAHNQRSMVTLSVLIREFVWLEEFILLIERSASSEIFSHLKREDEKHITENAYDNPVFVEDIVRNVAYALERDSRIEWFSIQAESFESIHNHSAYASIERTLKPGD